MKFIRTDAIRYTGLKRRSTPENSPENAPHVIHSRGSDEIFEWKPFKMTTTGGSSSWSWSETAICGLVSTCLARRAWEAPFENLS